MKIMSKIAGLFLLATVITLPAFGKAPRKCDRLQNLNLTEAQRTALCQLEQRQDSLKKSQRDQCRQERKNCDSTMRARHQETVKTYLQEVKTIIGPENYVIFLENSFINKCNNKTGNFKKNHKPGRRHESKATCDQAQQCDKSANQGECMMRQGQKDNSNHQKTGHKRHGRPQSRTQQNSAPSAN